MVARKASRIRSTRSARRPVAGLQRSDRAVVSRDVPPNGRMFEVGGLGGRNRLSVDNGTNTHALVTVARGAVVVVRVFVRAHDNASVARVPGGPHNVFVVFGRGWDPARGRMLSPHAVRFTRPIDLAGTGLAATHTTLTLHPVSRGNARTRPIPTSRVP